jgi:subtilisin family serine protease
MRYRAGMFEMWSARTAHLAAALLCALTITACDTRDGGDAESGPESPAGSTAPVAPTRSPAVWTPTATGAANVVPGSVIVKLRSAGPTGAKALGAVLARPDVRAAHPFLPAATARSQRGALGALATIYRLEVAGDAEVVAAELRRDPQVAYAQPNYRVTASYTPDDPYLASSGSFGQPYPDLWGLHTTRAPAAWDRGRGGGVVVAVIDTGLDRSHPDIAGNLWVDAVEVANGIDDDGNGYVDDALGWDFVSGDGDPTDGHGHGTHVAGTIAAQDGNGVGIVGIAPDARILAVKGLDDHGSGDTFALAQAIVYAAGKGAGVINNSWGCSWCPTNPVVEDAVRVAHDLGSVVVFAAGNASLDVKNVSPQNFAYSITVGASAPDESRPSFSNFGLIDVAAPGAGLAVGPPDAEPGRGILSLRSEVCNPGMCPPELWVGDRYLRQAGTSMAAPHVAGLAALIRGQHPDYGVEQVRQVLRRSAVDTGAPGVDNDAGYGRIDAAAALAEPAPLVAFVRSAALAPGGAAITIDGAVAGPGLAGWRAEVGTGSPPLGWSLIAHGSGAIDGTVATWDVAAIGDGDYTLRLVATTGDGRSYEDRHPFVLDRVRLDTPAARSVHRGGASIAITGAVATAGFGGFTVHVEDASFQRIPADITLVGGGQVPVDGGLLATWSTAGVAAGHYQIVLTVQSHSGPVIERAELIVDPMLHEGWPRQLDLFVQGPLSLSITDAVTLADIDGDGGADFVMAYNGQLWAYRHDGTPLPGWPQSVDPNHRGAIAQRSPAVADLDGDGDVELVVSNNLDELLVWNHDGTFYPGWPMNLGGAIHSSVLVDLDGNGTTDIVTADWWGRVNAVRLDGSYLPGFPAYVGGITAPPTVADLDGDGHLEVVVTNQYTQVSVIGHDGWTRPGWPQSVAATYQAVGDLDGDGDLEIVVGTPSGQVTAYHHDGAIAAGWPRSTGATTNISIPTVGDLDGDGRAEVVIGTIADRNDSVLWVWSGAGQVLPGWPRTVDGRWFPGFGHAGSALADVDGDGAIDIVSSRGIGRFDSSVEAYRRDGSRIDSLSRPALAPGGYLDMVPAIGDMDGDGRLELAWIDMDGRVFVWDLAAPATAPRGCAMFQCDAAHTGAPVRADRPDDDCRSDRLTAVAATASSVEMATTPAAAAIDGDPATRWSSLFSDPQWLQLDLGAERHLDRVVLRWEAAASRHFVIEVSPDGAAWTPVFTETAGDGGVDDIGIDADGRYLRIGSLARTTPWGVSLWEVELYGDADPTCDDPVTLPCGDAPLAVAGAAASSVETPQFPASAAIDGNPATRWSSLFADPQWLQLDLGSRKHVSGLVLRWEAAYSRRYDLEVSTDGSSWRTVRNVLDGDGNVDLLFGLGEKVRHLRIWSWARATPWGNSLWEVEVRGDDDAACGM